MSQILIAISMVCSTVHVTQEAKTTCERYLLSCSMNTQGSKDKSLNKCVIKYLKLENK